MKKSPSRGSGGVPSRQSGLAEEGDERNDSQPGSRIARSGDQPIKMRAQRAKEGAPPAGGR